MPTTIMRFDQKMTRTVDGLRKNGESRAEIVQQSIALFKVCVQARHQNQAVMLIDKHGNEREIIL